MRSKYPTGEVLGLDLSLIQPEKYVLELECVQTRLTDFESQNSSQSPLLSTRYRVALAWLGFRFLGFNTHTDAQWQYYKLARNIPESLHVRKGLITHLGQN